jgi:hypothetical protein
MADMIIDQERLDYLKKHREFGKLINPKPSDKEIERRKQLLLEQRMVRE